MNKIRRIFTKWYVNRGYAFGYDFTNTPVFDDGYLKLPMGMPKVVWNCPWWVRPLLIFFSPSTYVMESYSKPFFEGLIEGMNKAVLKGE